jgi:hypothetical protein
MTLLLTGMLLGLVLTKVALAEEAEVQRDMTLKEQQLVQECSESLQRLSRHISMTYRLGVVNHQLLQADKDRQKMVLVPLEPPGKGTTEIHAIYDGESYFIKSEPMQVDPILKGHQTFAKMRFWSDGKSVAAYTEGEARLQRGPVGASHVTTSLLGAVTMKDAILYACDKQWIAFTLDMSVDQVNEAARRYGIQSRGTFDPSRKTFSITDEIVVKHLSTRLGVKAAKRTVVFSAESPVRPMEVTIERYGGLYKQLNFAWGGEDKGKLPISVKIKRYFPERSEPRAKTVLLQEQNIEVDQKSVAVGDTVKVPPFDKAFPADVEIFEIPAGKPRGSLVAPPDGGDAVSAAARHRDSTLFAALIVLIVGFWSALAFRSLVMK